MKTIVKIKYNADSIRTDITYGNEVFDTTKINGKTIGEWTYSFIVKSIRWNGIYDELKEFLAKDEFTILFDGSDSDLEILRQALKDTPVKIAGNNNKVVILYKNSPLSTKITVNGKIFDVTKLKNRYIDEWIYPFQFKDVKWNGIFSELENFLGTDIYSIQFVGEQGDMKELMNNCPENVSISFKAPVSSSKSFSNVSVAGNAIIGSAKDKLGSITQNNENVQKAKEAALNAGKKFDEGVSNAVNNIKNSEAYNKMMENENVKKVVNNEQVKKVTSFWSKIDKKLRYVICIVGILVVILIPVVCLTSGNTIKLSCEDMSTAEKCTNKCKAGYIGCCSFNEGILYTF